MDKAGYTEFVLVTCFVLGKMDKGSMFSIVVQLFGGGEKEEKKGKGKGMFEAITYLSGGGKWIKIGWYRVWWLLVGGDNIWIKVIHWSFLQCWIESGQKDKGRMFGFCFLTHYNVEEEPGTEPVGHGACLIHCSLDWHRQIIED